MQNNKPAIVVIAYNRSNSLNRLLNSLKNAYYTLNNIKLIISIDKATNNQDVLDVAKKFQWNLGEKEIKYQSENLGLRKHVIECASYCDFYGSVILLEDDLLVSPQFYNYACQALDFSKNKDYIGGVSLYNHQFNVNSLTNFSPIEDGYDNWYFQFASSWGQAWNKDQWNKFMCWYNLNQNLLLTPEVPENITNWSDKSWLKYFIHYLVLNNKYFIYPKVSLSTNFSDLGIHMKEQSSLFQVPLDYSKTKNYCFSEYKNSHSTYDVFFENNQLHKVLNLKNEQLCVDLYGNKPVNNVKQQFLLTSKIYNLKVIKTFGCEMKPMDLNIINNIEGDDIYLYDTTKKRKNPNKLNVSRQIFYSIKHLKRQDARKLFITLYYQRFSKIFKNFLG